MSQALPKSIIGAKRQYFVGGSDARIIMGNDAAALLRVWREKRGEAEPENLSGNLIVRLGNATEDLNQRWTLISAGTRPIPERSSRTLRKGTKQLKVSWRRASRLLTGVVTVLISAIAAQRFYGHFGRSALTSQPKQFGL
jgi:hypothetical protein